MKLIPSLFAAAILCGPALGAGPLDASKLHLPEMPLHDPYIVADQASKTYFLYTSNVPPMSGTTGVGTMVYTSKDLLNWERPKVVFLVPKSAFATEGGWAPEVHPYHGRYYLFTTLHNHDKAISQDRDASGTYVRGTITAVSDTLYGPFTMTNEQAAVPPANFMTLDGTL